MKFEHIEPLEIEQIEAELRKTAPQLPSQVRARVLQRIDNVAANIEEKQARRQVRRTTFRRGFALAGAMALIFIGIKAWPMVSLELFLRRVEAATDKVRSAHIVSWVVTKDGRRVKNRETWGQDGKWRDEQWPVEQASKWRETRVIVDGRSWNYTHGSGEVVVRRAGPYDGWASNRGTAGLTGTAIINDMKRMSWNDKTEIKISDTTTDGRPTRTVDVHTVNDYETTDIALLVEAATDLPIRVEVSAVSRHGKSGKFLYEFSFNEVHPANLFKPEFPKSVKIFDYEKGKEQLHRRLAKGIAQRKVGDRTIAIRDLQVNAKGHVFLLYTAGRKDQGNNYAKFNAEVRYDGRDWDLNVTDQFGTEYVRAWKALRPSFDSISTTRNPPPNEHVYGGEKLDGDWLIPLKLQRAWKPRRFTITFRVPPVNQHGIRGVRDTPKTFHWPNFADKTKTVSFTFWVQKPSVSSIPDYMPYMAEGPQSEKDVQLADLR